MTKSDPALTAKTLYAIQRERLEKIYSKEEVDSLLTCACAVNMLFMKWGYEMSKSFVEVLSEINETSKQFTK